MPEAYEMIYQDAIGYSLTQSPFDRICSIAPQKNYVNLGFFFGAHLLDPHHLLVGEGKRMRHIKVRSIEDASNPELKQLLKDAWKDAPNSIANLHKRTGQNCIEPITQIHVVFRYFFATSKRQHEEW